MSNNQAILPFPSPISIASTNNTPVLTSLSSVAPVPLMSIGESDFLFTIATYMFTITADPFFVGLNDGYGLNSINNSSPTMSNINNKTNKNRRWPIDPPARHNFKYNQRRAKKPYRYQRHHQHQCYCRQCRSTPQMTTSGNILELNLSI